MDTVKMISYIIRNMKGFNNLIKSPVCLGTIFILLSSTLLLCLYSYNYYAIDSYFTSSRHNEENEMFPEEMFTEMSIEINIVKDFATALMHNDMAVYDLTDPDLWVRLDGWMSKHEPRFCITQIHSPLIGGGARGWNISIACILTEDSRKGWRSDGLYSLRIPDIIIVDRIIVGYGDVLEGVD